MTIAARRLANMGSYKHDSDNTYKPSRGLQIIVLRGYLDVCDAAPDQNPERIELEHVNNNTTSVHNNLDDTFEHISKILASSASSTGH